MRPRDQRRLQRARRLQNREGEDEVAEVRGREGSGEEDDREEVDPGDERLVENAPQLDANARPFGRSRAFASGLRRRHSGGSAPPGTPAGSSGTVVAGPAPASRGAGLPRPRRETSRRRDPVKQIGEAVADLRPREPRRTLGTALGETRPARRRRSRSARARGATRRRRAGSTRTGPRRLRPRAAEGCRSSTTGTSRSPWPRAQVARSLRRRLGRTSGQRVAIVGRQLLRADEPKMVNTIVAVPAARCACAAPRRSEHRLVRRSGASRGRVALRQRRRRRACRRSCADRASPRTGGTARLPQVAPMPPLEELGSFADHLASAWVDARRRLEAGERRLAHADDRRGHPAGPRQERLVAKPLRQRIEGRRDERPDVVHDDDGRDREASATEARAPA